MLAAGLIFLVEEAQWISPIVIQNKKDSNFIKVYVDYQSMNASCVHDLFLTPFSDEILNQVVVKEAYTFTDGSFQISLGPHC